MLSMPALLSRVTELPTKRLYLIAGPAASGKATFSLALARYLGAALLSMDHYYVDEEQVVRKYDEKYGLMPLLMRKILANIVSSLYIYYAGDDCLVAKTTFPLKISKT